MRDKKTEAASRNSVDWKQLAWDKVYHAEIQVNVSRSVHELSLEGLRAAKKIG